MITNHQRHRQTDRQTDGRTTCFRITKVHCAIKQWRKRRCRRGCEEATRHWHFWHKYNIGLYITHRPIYTVNSLLYVQNQEACVQNITTRQMSCVTTCRPTVWNRPNTCLHCRISPMKQFCPLPCDVTECQTVETFRRHLKHFRFLVHGHAHRQAGWRWLPNRECTVRHR